MSNIYTPRQQRILLITSLIIIAGFIIAGLRQYATAFLGAAILFVVFRPWFHTLTQKRKWNKTLVTVLLMLFSLIVIIMPFATLSVLLVDRIQQYARDPKQILSLVNQLEKATGFTITSQQNIKQMATQGASFASKQFPSILGGTLDFIVILGLLYFALYFMFTQEKTFIKGLRRYLPFDENTLDELGESLKNNVNANVLGQALVSFVQAILTGVTLWIFGTPDPAFWGMVAFFMAFIPVLGTPLVWGPAALIKFSQGATGEGIGILLVGVIVIINIDNLLRIMLARKMGDVHPLITLTGIVLGVPIFGILGLVIGPLLLSYFIVLMQVFERQNRQQRVEAVADEKRVEEQVER
ncbi:MAG: AI-2E family transporter [Cytophagales bacterium]|nr:MAG: AI-2E family transporter [Cytophagales bacterium]